MLSFKFFFGKYFQEDIFHVHNNFSVKVNFVNYRDRSRRELTTAANTRQILAADAAPNGGVILVVKSHSHWNNCPETPLAVRHRRIMPA